MQFEYIVGTAEHGCIVGIVKSFKSDAVAAEANLGTVGISGSNVSMPKSKFGALLAFPRLSHSSKACEST